MQSNDIITGTTYVAVVEGIPEEPKGTVSSYLRESKALIVYSSQNPEHGFLAVTHYELMKTSRYYAMLKINLSTGKKNQVRVHMKDIGHPVAGDKKYGAKTNPMGRLGLHAWVLAFDHPVNNEPMRFETPVPRKFMRLF
ncbi:MAG: RNA pseudouridine synthase [Bacteroidales bacterium]